MGYEIEGLELVDSEPVRSLLRHLAPGASLASPEALATHSTALDLARRFHDMAEHAGVRSVASAHSNGADVIVCTDHVNGRPPLEWTFGIGRDGRVAAVTAGPIVENVDFTVTAPTRLTRDERDEFHAVFAATYTDHDPGHLERQFSTMDLATTARRASKLIGLQLFGSRRITTDTLGEVHLGLPGLVCVDPAERRTGVAVGMGVRTMWRHGSEFGALDATAARLASPASLALALKEQRQYHWPTDDDLFELYDQPSPAQLELAEHAALAHGTLGYDPATGACIGHGRPIGSPIVEPDLPEEVQQRFAHIDRKRGDSLLWIAWRVPPPPTWTT
jgi:hypothetical protein